MPSECPVGGIRAVGFTPEDWWRHFDSDCNPLGKLYTFVEKPDDGDDPELVTDGGVDQPGKDHWEYQPRCPNCGCFCGEVVTGSTPYGPVWERCCLSCGLNVPECSYEDGTVSGCTQNATHRAAEQPNLRARLWCEDHAPEGSNPLPYVEDEYVGTQPVATDGGQPASATERSEAWEEPRDDEAERRFVEEHGNVEEITAGTILEYDDWQWALVTELATDREDPRLGFVLLDETGDYVTDRLEAANGCRQHYLAVEHLRDGEHEYWTDVDYVLNDDVFAVLGPIHPDFRDAEPEIRTDGGVDQPGTERLWDHEGCPRDGCEGELQDQGDYNVMCISCEEVFTSYCGAGGLYWLQDESGERVAEKEVATDGGYPHADKDLSGGPDGSARTPCCFEEVETETTHSDSGRPSGSIWRCPECGEEWQHPTETIGGPWGDSS